MTKLKNHSFKGEISILGSAATGALLAILSNPNSISINPLWIAAISSAIGTIFFACIMTIQGRWKDLLDAKGVKQSVMAGIAVGAIYMGLVHIGSYHTSPQNAAILLTFDTFVAMILLRGINGEKLSKKENLGGLLLVGSVAVLFLPQSSKPHLGDLILLLACCITVPGNVAMKAARRRIASCSIMFIRSLIGSILICMLACFCYGLPNQSDFKVSLIPLILNGLLALGLSKLLWVEGINLIPIAKAMALAATAPLLTFMLAYLFFGQMPHWNQLLSVPVCMLGLFLIGRKSSAGKDYA